MFTWYKQLYFTENPLDARPNPELVGLEEHEEKLRNFIVKEELCFLNGLTGSGKTSLLKKVQQDLTGHTFLYLDADALPTDFDLYTALKGKRSFFDKIQLKEMPEKKPVLIVDEFQATDPRLILEARSRWENPSERQIKSIVIAQISEQLKNVPGSFKDRLGNRIIHLAPLNNDSMKKVLAMRLNNRKTGANYYNNLSPQAIDFLVALADGNVRRLFEYTDMVFDFHYQRFKENNPIAGKSDYKVTYPAAKQILTVNNIPIDGYVLETAKQGKKGKKASEQKIIQTVSVPNNESITSIILDKKIEEKEPAKIQIETHAEEPKENFAKSNFLTDDAKFSKIILPNKINYAKLSKEEKKEEAVSLPEKQEPVRAAQTFDKEFTLAEQNVLRSLLRHEEMTLKQIATDIHLEINKCNGVIANLKKKNAIYPTNKIINGEKIWQLTESAKRALVVK